jgi:hypothetical protein
MRPKKTKPQIKRSATPNFWGLFCDAYCAYFEEGDPHHANIAMLSLLDYIQAHHAELYAHFHRLVHESNS